MTTRVSPSFIRVGHFDLFGRFHLHLLLENDVGGGGDGNVIDPCCALCVPPFIASPSCRFFFTPVNVLVITSPRRVRQARTAEAKASAVEELRLM